MDIGIEAMKFDVNENDFKRYLSEFPTCYGELVYLKSSKLGIHTITTKFMKQKDKKYEQAFDVPTYECRYNEKTKEVYLSRIMIDVPNSFKEDIEKMTVIERSKEDVNLIVDRSSAMVVITSKHIKLFCYDLITLNRINNKETYKYLIKLKEKSRVDDWSALVYLLHLFTSCLVANIPIGNIYVNNIHDVRTLIRKTEEIIFKLLDILS